MDETKKWDVFISHASEDKETFVRPLAIALRNLSVSVWYDEFSLRLGDSLSRSIDKGLAQSKFGVVVISHSFIQKRWPEYELGGLVSREIEEGRVILPVWHGVTHSQVLSFSPPLADKVALNTAVFDAKNVAIQILREVRPDLYDKYPRAELEKLVSGAAIQELKAELDKAREALSEYQCPYCGSSLSIKIDAPLDPEEMDWDVREIFECGYQSFGAYIERPCPSDPQFPKFEDYDLKFHHSPDEGHCKWQCYAMPLTDMARRLSLEPGIGRTKKEAEQAIRERYKRYAYKRAT